MKKKVVFILVAMLASAGAMAQSKDDVRDTVLPDKDFYQSLEAEGAEAYEAIDEDGQRVGGAIIAINAAKNHGELTEQREPSCSHEWPSRVGSRQGQFDQEDGLFRFEKRMAD